MDDANNAMAQQQQQQQFLLLQQYQQQQQRQHLLQQQQKHLLQQHHQHHDHHQQQQQHLLQPQQHHQHIQQQQAISRFPSSIDPHLRASGFRSLQLQQQQQQRQQQNPQPQPQPQHHNAHAQLPQQQQVWAAVAVVRQGNPVEMEMAQQDALKVCKPDFKRPFSSLEDAVCRLLPYHVVADYETEEDDRILDNDTTRQIPSCLQQWDHNILTKIAEITTTFEKQVLAFNIMSQKRALGEFRSEEKLKLEQALLQEEKQTLLQIKAEVKFGENADQEAEVVAKMQMGMVQA